mmetsp:Transcript_72392/g.172511  ORF Transcript_72392/g.172511 Transcript_72392/m.172511 type:complete len:281 (-) Transcript_72392:149-991(-)
MKRPAAVAVVPEGPAAKKAAKKQTTLMGLMIKKPSAEGLAGEAAECAQLPEGWSERWQGILGEGWFKVLEAEMRRSWFQKLMKDVEEARGRASVGASIFPPENAMFRAFQETPFEAVRVVIVGQDPYHQPGQAMGMCFSVPRGITVPPSLMNMLKEAGYWPHSHGDLTSWSQQGVFLLNTLLTVQESKPLSHKAFGWERFTDHAIRMLSSERKGIIFLLWGREAKEKAKLVDKDRHTVLMAGHPSPLSYEKHFKGCDHFNKVNELLRSSGAEEIRWQLPP